MLPQPTLWIPNSRDIWTGGTPKGWLWCYHWKVGLSAKAVLCVGTSVALAINHPSKQALWVVDSMRHWPAHTKKIGLSNWWIVIASSKTSWLWINLKYKIVNSFTMTVHKEWQQLHGDKFMADVSKAINFPSYHHFMASYSRTIQYLGSSTSEYTALHKLQVLIVELYLVWGFTPPFGFY